MVLWTKRTFVRGYVASLKYLRAIARNADKSSNLSIILLQLIGKMQFGTCQRMHVVVSLEHHQREFFNCAFAFVEIV